MDELRERLTRAFEDVLAANVPWFGGGGPGYYGVHLENVAEDGSEVELILTFRSGTRYCCFESGCHFADYDRRLWARLRESMDRHGLSHIRLPVIRKFRGVIEAGAVMTPDRTNPAYRSDAQTYETGPFEPLTDEAKRE